LYSVVVLCNVRLIHITPFPILSRFKRLYDRIISPITATLLIVNINDTFERVSRNIKEFREIAKQIEEEGGTAVTIQVLEGYQSRAKDSGIKDVKIIRREGNAAAEILLIADEEKVDAIVIGSTGMNTVKEFLLGGVSHKVIHHAKCLVTLVR